MTQSAQPEVRVVAVEQEDHKKLVAPGLPIKAMRAAKAALLGLLMAAVAVVEQEQLVDLLDPPQAIPLTAELVATA